MLVTNCNAKLEKFEISFIKKEIVNKLLFYFTLKI